MRIEDLKGRDVALWGLGREGWSTLRALRLRWPDLPLTVLDDRPLSEENADAIAAWGGVRAITGRAEVARALPRFDAVIKSPGISLYRPEIETARRRGVEMSSATRLWFAGAAEKRTVAVTGTKGKSTTASLIAHLLQASGLVVELRGNIGRPLLDPPDEPPDVWVIELSSYQTADLEADPSVAVLLNLYPEHLDWHGDVTTYFRDKLNLLAHQKSGRAVVNRADPESARFSELFQRPLWFNDPRGFSADAGFLRYRDQPVMPLACVALPGEHNRANVCAALAALHGVAPEVDPASLSHAVAAFRGLPHRLMPLGEKGGVLYVDDSISTTPESAMAALRAFAGRPVTLLLGGYERGLPYGELARFLVEKGVHAAVTLPPSGGRIAAAIRAAGKLRHLFEASDLEEAMATAERITPAGGVVLLSPAAPSYGAFRNFEERGKAFARLAAL